MIRDEERILWAIALSEFGAEALEQKVFGFLESLLRGELATESPLHVSAEGMAQLVGLLLSNIEAGERPLLGALRTMNRQHFRVLLGLRHRLTRSLLGDLPADLVPSGLLRLKAQLDLGV